MTWDGVRFSMSVRVMLAPVPALWLNQGLGARLAAEIGNDAVTADVQSSSWRTDESGDHHTDFGTIVIRNIEPPFPEPALLARTVDSAFVDAYAAASDAITLVNEYLSRIYAIGRRDGASRSSEVPNEQRF
jgi:hypothetical protein